MCDLEALRLTNVSRSPAINRLRLEQVSYSANRAQSAGGITPTTRRFAGRWATMPVRVLLSESYQGTSQALKDIYSGAAGSLK